MLLKKVFFKILSLGLLFNLGCSSFEEDPIYLDANNLTEQQLVSLQGMIDESLDDVVDLGSSFFVKNDVIIPKSKFQDYINQWSKTGKYNSYGRHFYTLAINTPGTGYRVIIVYFQGGNGLPASESFNTMDTVYSTWYKELGFAMLKFWNRFPDLKIKFERINLTISNLNAGRNVPAGTDIVITGDNGTLPNNVVAAAGFPSNGNPYNEIIINGDFLNGLRLTAGQKRWNLMHELGHCIGFRHTNLRLRGEPTVNPPANPIFATPNAEDPDSVFNGGTALSSGSWSDDDITALLDLY